MKRDIESTFDLDRCQYQKATEASLVVKRTSRGFLVLKDRENELPNKKISGREFFKRLPLNGIVLIVTDN